MMSCNWKHKVAALVVVGVLLVTGGAILFPVLDNYIHEKVKENVVLEPGTMTYKQFVSPTVPIYMEFYMFDIRNYIDVQGSGAKPYVTQKGPYTYREHRKKINIKENGNSTITYKQIRTFYFDKDRSCASCDPYKDNVTTVNLVLATLYSALKNEPQTFDYILTLFLPLLPKETGLFMTRSVNETIWGYHDAALKLAHNIPFLKTIFYTDFVGVFINKNNTDDGTYTVFSGKDNIDILGAIDKYNGSRYLPYWNSSQANMVNGTDGTLCPPFINKTVTLPMFSTDICRSVYGKYHSGMKTKNGDIPIYLFTGDHNELASVEENPSNAGFCTAWQGCMGSGVIDLSVCQSLDNFPIPVVISFPHFFMADQGYIDNITGMHPNAVEHRTEIGVEPLTGLVMHIVKRLQINMLIAPVSGIRMTENLKGPIIVPVLWINESMEISQDLSEQFDKMVTTPLVLSKVAKYGLIGLGSLLIVVAIIHGLIKFSTKPESPLPHDGDDVNVNTATTDQDETSPLLTGSTNNQS